MTWQALVPPRKNTVDKPGMCLRFSQTFFGAPVANPDAWTAWQNQQYRHDASEPLPDVPVLLWFEHWGSYGEPGQEVYKNWGHVAPYVPGDAVYSSPARWDAGWSQSRFATIAELERALNCRYVGWSEDLNGLRIAQNTGSSSTINPTIETDEEEEMANHFIAKIEGSKQTNAIFNPVSGFFHEFESANGKYNTDILKTFGITSPSATVSVSHYNAVKRDCAAVRTGK